MLKWVQSFSTIKGIVCSTARCILQMFSLEPRKSKETQCSDLKQMSRHSREVNTARVENVGFDSSTKSRFPLNIRLRVLSWFGSNPFPKNGSQAWTRVKIWRSTTKTNVKHNLAILVLECNRRLWNKYGFYPAVCTWIIHILAFWLKCVLC